MKRKSLLLKMAIMLMSVAILIAATGVALAQGVTLVYIFPDNQTVIPGQVFTADIYVEPAEPIIAVSASLSFDPALLTADSCEKGDVLKKADEECLPPPDCTFFWAVINNDTGTISPIWSNILVDGPSAVSKTGSWATITFTAGDTAGTSPLVFPPNTVSVQYSVPPIPPIETVVIGGSVTIEVPPAAPSGLTATAVSSSQIDLRWQDNSDNEDGFKIERRTGAESYTVIDTVGAEVENYSDTGLDPNTTYYYRVRAFNIAGYSGYSNEASATTPAGEGGGGCFIATAAYGSYLDSHVETLRDFRDSYMVTNPVGSALVSTYYKLSPPVAEFIDDHPALKPIVRVGLLPAVAMSTVAINTTSAEKVAIVGSLALVSVALAVWLRRRRGKGVIS